MPTFYDRFVECAERWPNNVALQLQRHDQIESCTYAELRRMAGIYGYGRKALTETEKRQLAALETRPRKVVAARADLTAAGASIRRVCQCERARVLLDRTVRILFQFGDFAELQCYSQHWPRYARSRLPGQGERALRAAR